MADELKNDEPKAEEMTIEEKVRAYNFEARSAQAQTVKPAKAKMTNKRKIGAAAAIIGGLMFAGLVAATAFAGLNKVAAKVNDEVIPFYEEQKEESGGKAPSFDGHAGVSDLPKETTPKAEKIKPAVPASEDEDDSEDMTVADVAAECMPSMVVITTTTVQEMQSYFGGGTQQYEGEASGTGIIIEATDNSLMIVTNNHVVADSETISVGFVDDTVVPAEILGRDVAEDLAVLSVRLEDIPDETLSAISIIEMGDSDDCRVGEQVVAIGNALGYGQSVSTGIISALGREVVVDGVNHTLIQTDAAINPGNSGGALLNMKGQLIGINEVKYAETTVEGMGYAIPTSKARPIIDRLMNREVREKVAEADRSYLGVVCVTIPQSYVSQGYPSGVYISEVVEGQAAEKAGIQVGDIVSAIDGYSVTTANELVNELEYYSAGSTVELTVLRLDEEKQQDGYRSTTIEVVLGARADANLDEDQKDVSPSDQESPAVQLPDEGEEPGQGGGEGGFPFDNWQDFFDLPFFR